MVGCHRERSSHFASRQSCLDTFRSSVRRVWDANFVASVRIAACAFRIHCIVFCEWSAEALERWSACGYLMEESALDMLRVVTAGLWFDGPMQLFAAEVLQGWRAG